MSELLGKAYIRAATGPVAANGFRKTGIVPFNRFVFTDVDFAPADVTDIPLLQTITPNYPESDDEGPFLGFDDEVLRTHGIITTQSSPSRKIDSLQPKPPSASSNPQPEPLKPLNSHPLPPMVSIPSTLISEFNVSPLMIRLLPKSSRRKTVSNRKTEKSAIVTSSPHRGALKVLQANKDIKLISKQKRSSKANTEKGGKRGRKNDRENLPQDTLCFYCGAMFSSSFNGDGWNQCHRCHSWMHSCTQVTCSCSE